jgi:NAD(P)-dependent dehydrogenase (short-subunit alcohol dehydrogenase family)
MSKTILVCGYGPGISSAIAEKFGADGFQVALVARNAEKLEAGVKALAAKGVEAAAFPTDLGDPAAAAKLVGRVRESLGPVSVIHWNAYGGSAGDLIAAEPADIRAAFDVAVTSLVATVKAALPDMKKADKPAVLVTNGGFGKIAPAADAAGVQFNAMGLSLANAAKDKLVGLLSKKLEADGVYVGQVMILGTVKGTAWDQGNATLAPSAIAEKFWSLYQTRTDVRAEIA